MRVLLIFLIFSFALQAKSGELDKEIDSLKQILNSDASDSLKIRSYNFLAHYYDMSDSTWAQDSAIYFLSRSKQLMESSKNPTQSSYAFVKTQQIYNKLQYHDKALDELLLYLETARTHKKQSWEADALSEIMEFFDFLKDTIRSEEYAQKLILFVDEVESKRTKADCFNLLGSHYKDRSDYEKSLEFHHKSLEIRLEQNDSSGAAYSYNNIGIVYKDLEEYEEALKYYFKSLELKEALGDLKGMAGTNINIAKVYLLNNQFDKGLPYVKKGLDLTEKAKAKKFQLVGYDVLYELEKNRRNYQAALTALEKKIELQEIVHNKNAVKEAKELERKYEAEKRLQQLKILEQKDEISELELKKNEEELAAQQNVILFFIVGTILVLILVIFLIINRNQKAKMNAELQLRNVEIQKQKEETELQKNIVEQKNKEVTDSIAYAKKIQSAILPSNQKVDSLLDHYFIMYQPKDIVAGDFYWVEELNDVIYVAAADCTGHGVPGAMVSVVCSNILSTVLHDEKVSEPAKILDRTKELVVEYFERSEEQVKDGMDIALIAIHKDKNGGVAEIEYAGANNPLIMIPPNTEDETLIEIKATKQPIGKRINSVPFENHALKPEKGSILYLFTDGFQDQFGGEHKGGKKLKSKNFHKLLYSYHRYDMLEQPVKLREALSKWQGDLEQVDDICVIGIRI